MDAKKDLKPELKEIYERVMNTTPSARKPEQPAQHSSPPPPPQPPTQEAKSQTAEQPTTQEPFLPASSPRPVNDSTGFVFSTHNKGPQKAQDNEEKKEDTQENEKTTEEKDTKTSKRKGNLLPIVFLLMAIFLAIYTVFWLFFFKIV